MRRILVTGAGGSAAINFIHSLRISPEKFYIVGSDVNKYHLELPNIDAAYEIAKADSPAYIEQINGVIHKENIEMVHPQPDIEVRVLSENREKIDAITYLPSKETIRICQDKMKTNKILEKAGVPVPEAYFIKKEEDLDKLDLLLEIYPERAWLRAIHGAGSRASLPIRKKEHAKMWIDYWHEMRGLGYGDFMLSEYLPGNEYAFQSIWKKGEIITSQARIRKEYVFGNLSPSGQSSSPSIAVTVHNEKVNEIATKAVLTIDKNATGIFCIDMKEDVNGKVKITEINAGRFFTTSNFFSVAGSNMPYYYIKMAFGEKIPDLPKYNAVPAGWYWIRLIDAKQKLIKGEKWKAKKI